MVCNVLFFDETRDGVNKIYLFIQLYTLYLSPSLIRLGKETKLLEVLLALPFGVHGIENRLSLCLIPFSELVYLPLHLRVQTGHSLLQFLVREKLQLQHMVVYLYSSFLFYHA